MKKMHWKAAGFLLLMTLTLSGCGSDFPEMTEDDYNQIVTITSGLLVKYSTGTVDKMTYLDKEYTPEYLLATEVPQPAHTQEAPGQQPPGQQPPAAQENPADPLSGTETTDIAAGTEGTGTATGAEAGTEGTATATGAEAGAEGTGTATGAVAGAEGTGTSTGAGGSGAASGGTEGAASQTSTAAVGDEVDVSNAIAVEASNLQQLASGVRVEYNGYSVRSVYPDEEAQGAVVADTGNRLLILDFQLKNVSDVAITLDTARQGPAYKLIINGKMQGFSQVTMIDNDLSSMIKPLAPGEKTDAVIVMEVDETLARSVDTLSLQMKYGTDSQTIHLE